MLWGLLEGESAIDVTIPHRRRASIPGVTIHRAAALEAQDLRPVDRIPVSGVDGYRYHSSLTDWSRDRTRHNELIALGWRILPVTFTVLNTDPIAVANQVARCLCSADVGKLHGK